MAPSTFLGEDVSPLVVLGVAAGSYLLGCFSTGFYLVRARAGKDIRELGSGSTGARNVGRVLGVTGFLLTMVVDAAKGGLAVWLALVVTGNGRMGFLALLAVVAGHVWPAQLGFHGGRGVSTSLMGLLVYDWRLAVAYGLLFGVGLVAIRELVATSLVVFAVLPAAGWWLRGDRARIWGSAMLAVLILGAHRKNIVEGIAEWRARRAAGPPSDPSAEES